MSEIHQSPKRPRQGNDKGCEPCIELDNPTQKSINRERVKICDLLLYDASEALSKQEIKYKGEKRVYNDKKCMFVWTEENYQRYRNLEITVGTELLQTNESVKANVTNYNKLNKDLGTALKNIAKQIKDVKAKFSEFKDFACKLDRCLKDKCNIAQVKALTGKSPGCEPETPIEECADAEAILHELVCLPEGLMMDIDSLFQSSHDVVGIQVFSNIDTLEPLQKTLETQSKDFEKQISEVMKLREGDMKKQQEDLVKSVQEITKAAMDRNNARSDFEGYLDAVDFLCCPDCECIPKNDDTGQQKDCDDCEPRLKDCEKCICNICEEVKKAFCCMPPEKPKDGKC